MSNLYHYTTFNSLKKILNSDSLRFSKCCNVRAKTEESELCDVLHLNREIIQNLALDLSLHQKQLLNNCLQQRRNSYIFCTCQTFCNQYLWEKYAENEICIEFDNKYFPFSPGRSAESGKFPGNFFIKIHTLYGEEDFKRELIKIVEGKNQFPPTLLLSMLMDRYKIEKYRVEQETRAVYFSKSVIKTSQKDELFYNQRRFQMIPLNNNIYYQILSDDGKYSIKQAILKIYYANKKIEKDLVDLCQKYQLDRPLEYYAL